jgi:hypothetical protein
MKLLVAGKQMNLQKRYRQQSVVEVIRSLALTCSAIALALCTNGLPVLAAETPSENSRRTFADWCRDRAALNPEAKHTVEVLLTIVGTTECEEGERKLSCIAKLDLAGKNISDIKPLQSFPSSYSQAKAIPNYGENVRAFPATAYKCNRFVGDAYAIGAKAGYAPHGRGGRFPTGVSQIPFDPRPGYPVSANELASANPARRSLTNLPLSQTPQTGDIISFDLPGQIDHTGINLGNNVYISARNSEERPVWSMQPKDGVQITRVPPNFK